MKDEPAFPKMLSELATGPRKHWLAGGLSKRELFAAMAMQGIVVNGFTTWEAEASKLAVRHADALIAELERTKEK